MEMGTRRARAATTAPMRAEPIRYGTAIESPRWPSAESGLSQEPQTASWTTGVVGSPTSTNTARIARIHTSATEAPTLTATAREARPMRVRTSPMAAPTPEASSGSAGKDAKAAPCSADTATSGPAANPPTAEATTAPRRTSGDSAASLREPKTPEARPPTTQEAAENQATHAWLACSR
ncbi:hypothetical protein GCM10029992_06420 [Glycomyces albus]